MRRIERKWEELKIVILSYIWLIWLASSSMTFRTLLCISFQIWYYIVQNIFAFTYPLSLLLSLSLGLRLSDCVSFSISLLPLSLTLSLSPSHKHTLSLSLPLPHSLTLTPCLSLILEFISISVNVARSTFCFFQNKFLHFLKIGISLSALLIVSY